MKRSILTALSALFFVAASSAQEFTETFSTGALPAGWTVDTTFNYGNRDFANGRMNVYPTDAGIRIFHPLAVPSSATKVIVTFDGNLANSSIGETNWLEVRAANGDLHSIHHGFGDWTRDTGFNAGTMVQFYNLNNIAGTVIRLADQRVAKIFGNYSYSVTFEDGRITQLVYSNGSLFSQQTVNAPNLRVHELTQLGLALYTTTGAAIWADNVKVAFGYDCAELEQALIDAVAALAAANADNLSLQQQLAQANAVNSNLQSQLNAANASITALQQQLTAAQAQVAQLMVEKIALQQQLTQANENLDLIDNAVAAVETDLRQAFGDPGFIIPGASTAARVQALATAVIELNQGRAQGIYIALKP